MKLLTPGERRQMASITVDEPCIHGSEAAHDHCPGGTTISIPFPRNPGQIPKAIAEALQEDAHTENQPVTVPSDHLSIELSRPWLDSIEPIVPGPEPIIDTHAIRRTDIMTTLKRRAQKDWGLWLVIAAHVLIAWPMQYLFVAPVVTLGSWTWTAIKAVAKVGAVGFVLLFIPLIGWAILAVWMISKNRDRDAERRHVETMAAMGVEFDQPAPVTPLWQTVWVPWRFGL